MEKLKPCPFCGSTNVAISPYDGAKTVVCMDCLCMSAAYRGENAEASAIAAWNRRAVPENKALTLDELKKMDGEPVWIEFKNRNSKTGKFVGWAIMDSNYDYLPFMGDELRPKFEWYGRSWLAYARKPEGSET